MKQIIFLFGLVLCVLSCNNHTKKKISNKTTPNTSLNSSNINKKSNIYIKNKSQYDQTFIEGLVDYENSLKLIDNYILINNDTTYFPEELPLNQKILFKGKKDDNIFELTVTRENLTNLNYGLLIIDKKGETIFDKSGKAILGSLFFLAPENDDDFEADEGYASSEYWDNTKNCSFSIRIGFGSDNNNKKRAKFTYGCEEINGKNLKIDDCPTLRSE
ncbi:MAG: hypothetical protein PHV20_06380 [Bacteroidales bacterium]|nr:hypothetical protein [Bacteroidales bacterium]